MIDLNELREELAVRMVQEARRSFDDPRIGFKLADVMNATVETPLVIEEEISGLKNPISRLTDAELQTGLGEYADGIASGSVRQVHTALIHRFMRSSSHEALLVGFPGAGKTTALRRFVADLTGGCLFFYFSPRIMVNEGLIKKFAEDSRTNNFALINTDSHVIGTAHRVLPEEPSRAVILTGVDAGTLPRSDQMVFLSRDDFNKLSYGMSKEERAAARPAVLMRSETIMAQNQNRISGVLGTIAYATRSLIEHGHNRVVATVSIQANRLNRQGNPTTRSFRTNLFKPSDLQNGKPTLDALKRLAVRCPTVIICIDEISGDPAGAGLYAEMRRLLFGTFRDPFIDAGQPCPFDLKLIVADASLNNARIANQYLRDALPASDRIYVEPVEGDPAPEYISYQEMRHLKPKRNSVFINANAYPSSDPLRIRYHMMLNRVLDSGDQAEKWENQSRAAHYIEDLLRRSLRQTNYEQIIVFVQDKNRLYDMQARLVADFGQDAVLVCNADMSRDERDSMPKRIPTARIVLMTSSAARGIDFPKAQQIIVEVPSFNLEANLMEIAQAIYRGRGEDETGRGRDADPRVLDIVVSRNVFENQEAGPGGMEQQALAVVNLMLITRTVIHTRLKGWGRFGRRNIAMIPTGGKSLETAGESLSGNIDDFCRSLRNTARKFGRDDPMMAACMALDAELQGIFRDADYRFDDAEARDHNGVLCQKMKEQFGTSFRNALRKGFGHVVTMDPYPIRAVCFGQMVIEPLDGTVTEKIRFQTWSQSVMKQIRRCQGIMENLDRSELPSGLQKQVDRIESWLRSIRPIMRETEFIDRFGSATQSSRFLAVPIASYLSAPRLVQYRPEIRQKPHLRDILKRYVNAHATATDVIPRVVDNAYHGTKPFPFLAFSNPYLRNINVKWFSKEHLAATPDFNLLNLLLLSEEKSE